MMARFGYFTQPHPGIYYTSKAGTSGLKLDPNDPHWAMVRPLAQLGQIDDLNELVIADMNKFKSSILVLIETLSAYNLHNITNLAHIMLVILGQTKLASPSSYSPTEAKISFINSLEQSRVNVGLNIYHAACHEIAQAVVNKPTNMFDDLRISIDHTSAWLCPTWLNIPDKRVSLADNIWFYFIGPAQAGQEFDTKFLRQLGRHLSKYLWPEESTKTMEIYTRDILCLFAVRQLFTEECAEKIMQILRSQLFDPTLGLFIQGSAWLGSTWSGIYAGFSCRGEPLILSAKTVRSPSQVLSCQDQIWAILCLGPARLEQIIAPCTGPKLWQHIRQHFGRFNGTKLCGLGHNNFIDNVISFDNTLAGIIAGKILAEHAQSVPESTELTQLHRDIYTMEEYVLSRGTLGESSETADTNFGFMSYPLGNIGTAAWFTFYSFNFNPLSMAD